jgi:formate hydrogenlyase subunit 6/NADH:ubiquinone oxidoreductase subunit I
MKFIRITKNDWPKGLEKLQEAYQLFGPVKDKDFHSFQALEKDQYPDFDYLNSRLSPKAIIYPQSEKMFEFSLNEKDPDAHILKEVPRNYSPKAVLGIRPCDVKSFDLVKRNFVTKEYVDPYWQNAYDTTIFVGLACSEPCSNCFCTTAGCGPCYDDGMDILLVDEGDHFIAKVLTDKGDALMASAGWSESLEESEAVKRLEAFKKESEDRITSFITTDNLASKSTSDIYESNIWEEISFACINCGTCTYLCPTCWCFDIQDEVKGSSGCRIRNWDSCMYPLFTLHGSGHNPRNTKMMRVRQRFMHKLKYYVDKYGAGIQCVGCGRCVRYCPVNIDIRRVCELMNRAETCAT